MSPAPAARSASGDGQSRPPGRELVAHVGEPMQGLGVGPQETPVAITRDRRVLRSPTEAELAAALELDD